MGADRPIACVVPSSRQKEDTSNPACPRHRRLLSPQRGTQRANTEQESSGYRGACKCRDLTWEGGNRVEERKH